MQSLYSNGFEQLYDAMYQSFIDYSDEYSFYSSILKKYHKKSLLEIGSGSGRLAQFFLDSNFKYTGLDLSSEMINLSKARNPEGVFIKADISNFKLQSPVGAALITGRTTSYLTNNASLNNALKCIYNSLKPGGLLCFDFIDANRFLKSIKGGKHIVHEAHINNKHYIRKSFMIENTRLDNLMFDWSAQYFEKEGTKRNLLTMDESTVRAFTKNEWDILLHLNGFKVLEFIDRKSYAFDTFVVVAQKEG